MTDDREIADRFLTGVPDGSRISDAQFSLRHRYTVVSLFGPATLDGVDLIDSTLNEDDS